MLGHHAVHRVGEHDVRLARCKARFNELLEERARHRLCLRTLNRHFGDLQGQTPAPFAYRLHERVGDQNTVVQVERLTVEVARGLTDFEEFFDLRMR